MVSIGMKKLISTQYLVDRILRPIFPSDYHADVQLMISLNSIKFSTVME